MTIADSLHKIRLPWIAKVSSQTAHGESIRDVFQEQLDHFYDLLAKALATGEGEWLIPVLDIWVETRTQSELQNREAPLSTILDTIMQATYEVSCKVLTNVEALHLFGSLLPVFAYARNYINSRETGLLIEHISKELNKTRLTLERLDKTKSDFISIAAHELKTPLTLIDGYTSMLEERLKSQNTEDYYLLLLKGIYNGTQRLRQIVDDMIDA